MKFFIFIFTLLPLACSKDTSKDVTTNATVVWTGEVAADGCDWCIKTDSTHFYHPDHLDTAFLHDELDVKIVYELTSDKFYCGWGSTHPIIHVIDITK
jgi:hypothetical protein